MTDTSNLLFDVWLPAAAVILSIIFLVVAPYLITRFFLRAHAAEDTQSLANSVVFRTASLHGLVLAMIFAQEQMNLFELRRTVAREAAAAADIFYDLDRYDGEANLNLRKAIAFYVQVVVEEEWLALQDGGLSQAAWNLWDQVYRGVLDLVPENPRQIALRERMLKDIETLSESRNLRRADHTSGVTILFWFVALSGVIFVVLPYFVFRARLTNLLLLATFAAYNGVVFFTILAMSNPYTPPGAIRPVAFEEIFVPDMKQLLEETGDAAG